MLDRIQALEKQIGEERKRLNQYESLVSLTKGEVLQTQGALKELKGLLENANS